MNILIRTLTPDDGSAFKAVRLDGLEKEGRCFTADYAAESQRGLQDWALICTETHDRAIFGAEQDGKLVGIMAATKWDDQTVRWGWAYIQKEFRQHRLGEKLHSLREEWCQEHGYTKAIFTIRADNQRSLDIHLDLGARITGEELMNFADGSVAKTYWLERQIAVPAVQAA